MFKTKIPLQKIVAYFFIGFICFLLIIFFVGTDIISSFGGRSIDPNVIATVNGQKLFRLDFFRFAQQYRDQDIEGKELFILDQLISNVLFIQRARTLGIDPTEERVTKHIRGYFKDKNTGIFDEDQFDEYLKRSRFSVAEFYKNAYKDVIADEFRKLIQMGIAVTADDVQTEHRFLNSQCAIRYVYITHDDFKARIMSNVQITDFELKVAMDKSKGKFSDDETNKRVTREALIEDKFKAKAKEVFDAVNDIARKGGTFDQAAAALGGKTGTSPLFILGETLNKEFKGDPVVAELGKSPQFIEDCIFTGPQKSSRLIVTSGGIGVITPLQFKLAAGEPTGNEYNAILDRLVKESFASASGKLIAYLREEAKIVKNLKTD